MDSLSMNGVQRRAYHQHITTTPAPPLPPQQDQEVGNCNVASTAEKKSKSFPLNIDLNIWPEDKDLNSPVTMNDDSAAYAAAEKKRSSINVYEKMEKRVLLNIDLNIDLPEKEDDFDCSAVAMNGGVIDMHAQSNEFDTTCILPESPAGGGVNVDGKTGEATEVSAAVSPATVEERERRRKRWDALLEVVEIRSLEFEKDHENLTREVTRCRDEEELSGNSVNVRRKKKNKGPIQNVVAQDGYYYNYKNQSRLKTRSCGKNEEREFGGDSVKVPKRNKNKGPSLNAVVQDEETDEAVRVVAEQPVVRSNRGRNQVLPHKYRDTIIESPAEMSRPIRSGRSASKPPRVPTKTRSRWYVGKFLD